jgi:hypothetical protein
MSRPFSRAIASLVIASFLPLATTACFGRFALTRKIYAFNQDISKDKWIRWLAFLVLVIVPIYGIGTLVDAIFANSVEFWSGKNPIADAGTTRYAFGPNGEVASMTLQADRSVAVAISEPSGAVRHLRLVREPGSVAAFGESGELIARVSDVDGHPALVASAR